MRKQSKSVLSIAISFRQKTLSEPSGSIIRVHDLGFEETLIRQIAVVQPQVQVSKICPDNRILSPSISLSSQNERAPHLSIQLKGNNESVLSDLRPGVGTYHAQSVPKPLIPRVPL